MKKFLIFLVATIVTVCLGMTFYQFAKNDEVIKVNTQTIYINYGDKLSLDDLGFSRKEASKDTKINFNAGGKEVTSIIKYDATTKSYIPTEKGGATTIKISTTNRKYKVFNIDVVVGIGTEEFPYYISTEDQLFNIGAKYNLDACYELINDISLTKTHTPIGVVDGKYNEFTGKFDGNYHTISNLTINNCNYGGLFAIIGSNSSVSNLSLEKPVLTGEFTNVGAVAGICYGNINKVIVSNASINNSSSSSNTGAVVGLLKTDTINNSEEIISTASILRTSAYSTDEYAITSNGTLGGIAGTVESALVHACYTDLTLKNISNSKTGGLIGDLVVNRDTYVRESYSISKIQSSGISGNLIGDISLETGVQLSDITKELVLVGLYYDNSLNTLKGVGSDDNNISTSTNFAVTGKTTSELKTKSNYVYYINASNSVVYWDKVWLLVDGEYPRLTFVSKFEDVIIGNTTNNPSNPNETPSNPEDNETPDISNPETPNVNAVIISNKADLIKYFQESNTINGNFILNSDIDLEGYSWNPVKFSGILGSSNNKSYTISNFIINSSDLYAGFFYSLSSADIKNINFANVTVKENGSNETSAVVVGYIRGNTAITNVNVKRAVIESSTKYAGGIAGYIGNSIVKIKNCQVQSLTIGDKALNVGGIAGFVSANTYIDECKLLGTNSLSAIDRLGGIASVNYGKINDSCFFGNLSSTSLASNVGYFGGLCGINYNIVTNSSSYAEINIFNVSSSSDNISYFVGGLCGYNIGSFDNSSAYAERYTANNPGSSVFLAGLTGYNKGSLNSCYASVDNVGEVKSHVYVAGLSIFNYGGKITGCSFVGNLSGYQVAGLVRLNTNEGIIDSCMVTKDTNTRAIFKGIQVSAFAYELANGSITNCLVSAELISTSTSGWVAGFVGFMPCNGSKFGTLSHSISNVKLSGSGNMYLDLAQRGLMKKKRTSGTITNCVLSADAEVEGVIKSEYSKFLWIEQEPGSKSNYIIAGTLAIQNLQTYIDVDNCNFDIAAGSGNSKWLYINNTQLPIPRAVAEMIDHQ